MKKLIFPYLLFFVSGIGMAQNVGDYPTAGVDFSRSYLNSDARDFGPPLGLLRTVPLSSVTEAANFIHFENFYLVGHGSNPVNYTLHNEVSGAVQWTNTIAGSGNVNYVPATANDIAILGGPSTATVKAVKVSTGTQLWEDTSVGPAIGRHPVMTDDIAIYSGRGKLVARAGTGTVFWSSASTTAQAPIAVHGNRVYSIDGGTLRARALRGDGTVLWSAAIGGDGSNIIATEKFVFVSDPAAGKVQARRTTDGTQAWSRDFTGIGSPGIAQAYDMVFVFYSEAGSSRVAALNADNGTDIWDMTDPNTQMLQEPANPDAPRFPVIANNTLYFYNPNSGRIRALDAFSGVSVWSILETGAVHGLLVSNEQLHVLKDASVRVYEPIHQIYLAHLADGDVTVPDFGLVSATTLFVLNNLSDQPATGTLEFLNDDGDELALELIEGNATSVATSVEFVIPPHESISFQTVGASDPATGGWARATADQPISGNAIFQVSDVDTFLFEAGVADAVAIGRASVLATRFETPGELDFSTGIAAANPLGETANVTVEFRRDDGFSADASFTLGPLEHRAQFMEELFQGINTTEVTGTFVITSDIPIVITALRTQSGFQMSSYPVGQVRR